MYLWNSNLSLAIKNFIFETLKLKAINENIDIDVVPLPHIFVDSNSSYL